VPEGDPQFDLLPFNTGGLDNAPLTTADFFLAGDVRANENVLLLSLHALFVREHNGLCDELAQANPALSGEERHQRARAGSWAP